MHQLSVREVDPSQQIHQMNVSILGTGEDLEVSDSDMSLSLGLSTKTGSIPASVLPTSPTSSTAHEQNNKIEDGGTIKLDYYEPPEKSISDDVANGNGLVVEPNRTNGHLNSTMLNDNDNADGGAVFKQFEEVLSVSDLYRVLVVTDRKTQFVLTMVICTKKCILTIFKCNNHFVSY